MQSVENTADPKDKGPIGFIVTAATFWAFIGFILWVFGVLTISLVWILGPIAYLMDKHLTFIMIKAIVEKTVRKVLDEVDAEQTGEGAPQYIIYENDTGTVN